MVPGTGPEDNIFYVTYTDETMLPDIQRLVSKDLSEPYSIFTYRYFVHNWPDQCICGFVNVPTADGAGTRREMIATIVSKAEEQEFGMKQGYIAMLAVDKRYRNRGIGSYLVRKGIEAMVRAGCSEIMLETEVRAAFAGTARRRQLTRLFLCRRAIRGRCRCTRGWAS